MNTDTGRIYDPDEYEHRLSLLDGARYELRELEAIDEHQAEFAIAHAAGKIVPVSADVAQQVRLGQRELERRAKRRKAAKRARRTNR